MQISREDEFYLTGDVIINLSEAIKETFSINMQPQAEMVMSKLIEGLIKVEEEGL